MLATRESYPSVFCVLFCSRFKFQGGCVDWPSWRHRPVPSLGRGPARLVPIGEEETPQKETCVLLGREQKWKATEQQRSLRPVSLLPTVWLLSQSVYFVFVLVTVGYHALTIRVLTDILTLFLKLLSGHQEYSSLLFLLHRPQFCLLYPFILPPFLPLNLHLCISQGLFQALFSFSLTLSFYIGAISMTLGAPGETVSHIFLSFNRDQHFQMEAGIAMTQITPHRQRTSTWIHHLSLTYPLLSIFPILSTIFILFISPSFPS